MKIACFAVLGLCACKVTEIVVAVGSDLVVPTQIDRVMIRVDRSQEQLSLSWDLAKVPEPGASRCPARWVCYRGEVPTRRR